MLEPLKKLVGDYNRASEAGQSKALDRFRELMTRDTQALARMRNMLRRDRDRDIGMER